MEKYTQSPGNFLIVAPYLDNWQWMFVSEYALERRLQGHKVQIIAIEVLDFRGCLNFALRLVKKSPIHSRIFSRLKSKGVKLEFVNVLPDFRIRKVSVDNRGRYSRSNFLQQIAYPNLIDSLGSMKIHPQRDKRQILRLVREAGGVVRILKKFDLENGIEISTPSGRYCRNKAVIDFFREAGGVTTKVLESGSHGHYEVVTDAQSVSELGELVEKYWLDSHDADKLLIGESFFEERITQARSKSDEWTHSMIPGFLPALNEGKKLCVFYTTTQIEFEGTGDPQKPDEFENQVEAIKFLRMKLPISEWDLVVRRHPRRADVNHLDRDLLEGIEKIENVIVVDGDSKVDSYALGNVADLIFHFGSTIGAEFTFLGKVPVYALKLTFWWKFSKDHHLCKKNQLDNLDLKKLAIADPASVLPWGYYLKRGGLPFKHLKEIDGYWTLDGVPIKRKDSKST